MSKYYCNFWRLEDTKKISVECESKEDAELYALELRGAPVINITVTKKPTHIVER